jgi:hypothetical protein
MGFDRRWLESIGSEDSHGRALWGLGAIVGRTEQTNLRDWAARLFEQALPALEGFTSPRAWAFAVLGLHDYLRALTWLQRAQTAPEGHFRPIGSEGFWLRGQLPATHDQQPLEATACVAACIEAFHATGDEHWRQEAIRGFDWFLGRNDLRQPLYDGSNGGCFDGLQPTGVNSEDVTTHP